MEQRKETEEEMSKITPYIKVQPILGNIQGWQINAPKTDLESTRQELHST